MKHWPRTTGLSFQSMHENMGAFNRIMPIDVVYTETKSMVADLLTKAVSKATYLGLINSLLGYEVM